MAVRERGERDGVPLLVLDGAGSRVFPRLLDPVAPTTAARFGGSLYLINARFDEAFPPFLGGNLGAGLGNQ